MLNEQEIKNRKLAADLLAQYAHNDHDGILKLVTDDCVFTIGGSKSGSPVPYHGIHQGHEKIAGYLRKRRANSNRDECLIKHPTSGATPEPSRPHDTETSSDARRMPMHERFIVQDNVVVAMGTLKDSFADGKPMHTSDFVIVFRIDQEQNKISSFQYFFDTESVADAWRRREAHKVGHAGESHAGH